MSLKHLHVRQCVGVRAWLIPFLIVALCSVAVSDDRTIIRPGLNIFSPQQDIELGKRAAAEVPKQFPLLNNKRVDDYLQSVGMRLVAHVPKDTYSYPYQYRCVNSNQINAFALPGGFIYVNRAVIEKADDEAQLAAVMAHETAHVVLRHGTNQATKASGAQLALGIVGALVGGNAAAAIVTQIFGGVGVPLVFLKMSRTDESQADILGTQILHDAGYDPQAMADFFQKLQGQKQPAEFFSDHPSPEHRIARIDEEVDRMGRPLPNATRDTQEFEKIKKYVKSLPPAPKAKSAGSAAESGTPPAPSAQYITMSNSKFSLAYPDNWNTQAEQNGGVFLAPLGGVIPADHGNPGIAYGVIVSTFAMQSPNGEAPSLEQATSRLIAKLKETNSEMQVVERDASANLGGQSAISTRLQSDSPAGGRESDWLTTTMRPDGLFYILCVVPEKDKDTYESAFRAILRSLKFAGQ